MSSFLSESIQPPTNRNREPDLQQLLDESERRKEQEIKQTGSIFNLLVGIPIAVFALWAGIFLITYDATPITPSVKPDPVATAGSNPEDQDLAQYDLFRPEKDKIVKSANPAELGGRIVDKEDIHFAMELLNFMHQPSKPGGNAHPGE